MSLVTPAELNALARRAGVEAHDEESESQLARQLSEYISRRREALSAFSLEVDGQPEPTFFHALAHSENTFTSASIKLTNPPPIGPRWDYLRPFGEILLLPDGSAEVYDFGKGGAPRRAMARFMLRERFMPQPRGGPNASARPPRTGLASAKDSATLLRSTGVVPFSVNLLLYFPENRVRIEIDLVDNLVLPDIRAGRLPLNRFVQRSSRISHGIDAFIARGDLSLVASRALEVLVETHGMTSIELSQILGGMTASSNMALETLRARHLASVESPSGTYRAELDAFLGAGRTVPVPEASLPPLANPALRSSVTELLAAADSHAMCPLCGDALPAGARGGILCSKCAAEVGYATPIGR